jgi:hypothetical protein
MYNYQRRSKRISRLPEEVVLRYENVRKHKMYHQHNNQKRIVHFRGIYDFLGSLKDIQALKICLHYQQLGPTTQQDITPVTLTKFEH